MPLSFVAGTFKDLKVTCRPDSGPTSAPQCSVITVEMWNAAVFRCLCTTQMLSIMLFIWTHFNYDSCST